MSEKPSYYGIIPANVRYDKRLTPNSKLLYSEITALCNAKGYCWSTNKYFAELYEVSTTSISKWISSLVEFGYLKSTIKYKEGSKEILHRYLSLVNYPIEEKLNTPIEEKLKDNSTSINNTINKDTFSKIKDFQGYLSSFALNKTYFYIAYRFWELWKKENPNNKTILDAKVLKWYDAIRLIIEVDKQKADRLLAIYFYFEKCHLNEVGFDRFWFDTVKSVGALRNKDKNDVYRIDKIIDKVNSKIQSDNFFNQYVNAKIAEFKKYEITKLH